MDKYGLIGYPLGHSFSISYFNEKFKNEGIDAIYENYEIPTIEQLPEVLDTNPELRGLNVTIPYKEKVISYLDGLSPEASEIGAVNVIKVEHKGKKTVLKGYNSDVIGFTRSIEPLLESYHKKALILGTGGASRGHRLWIKIAETRDTEGEPLRERRSYQIYGCHSGDDEGIQCHRQLHALRHVPACR